MLNEPVQEAGQEGSSVGVAEAGGGSMNYIQVTPQEKEAIERVRRVTHFQFKRLLYIICRLTISNINAQIQLNTICPISPIFRY